MKLFPLRTSFNQYGRFWLVMAVWPVFEASLKICAQRQLIHRKVGHLSSKVADEGSHSCGDLLRGAGHANIAP